MLKKSTHEFGNLLHLPAIFPQAMSVELQKLLNLRGLRFPSVLKDCTQGKKYWHTPQNYSLK